MIKMIKKDIPIKFISDVSKREANSRKPIYSVHKWFGRKTDAIFRSLLLALELDNNINEDFKNVYYSDNHNILENKVILDPFMGGGVTLVNTLRLGGKAIGLDINPVAWFITKNELQLPVDITDNLMEQDITSILKEEFYNLEKKIGKEIKDAYTTYIYDEEAKKNKKVDIMYVFWVKQIQCPRCGNISNMFPCYALTKFNKEKCNDYSICPSCGCIIKGNKDVLTCCQCGYKFDRTKGIYQGRSFICTECGSKWNVVRDIMKNQKSTLPYRMYAIEYYDSLTGKKGFKVPDKYDLENYIKTKEKVRKLRKHVDKFIPQTKIPEGHNTKQLKNHNYTYWKQMFNYRQLYYLSRLLEEIDNIKNCTVKELFLCMFSNTINANNMFCIYNSQCGKIEPLFGDHHMAPVMNPVENNIWGTKLGRGTFLKYFKSFVDSKKFNVMPYERINISGKNKNIILENEKFFLKTAKNFEELLSKDKNTIIKCSTGENLSFIPSKSVDAVVTDPPYYMAINYSEISEFFYTWQRIILKNKYKFFKPQHISYKNEVTVNEVKGISKEEFVVRLSRCFYELKRVLKSGAPLVLTYNSSSPIGWGLIFKALSESGFYVEKTYPVHTELRAGLVDNRRCKMNYDLIIVAKVLAKENHKSISFDKFMIKLEEKFKKTYDELEDLAVQDVLLIKAGKAFELYSKYPNVFVKGAKIDIQYILERLYLLKNI